MLLLRPRRAIFQRNGDDSSTAATTAIPLDSINEAISWMKFVGYDLDLLKPKDLVDTARLSDLLFALGAKLDDGDDNDGATTDTLCLAPGPSEHSARSCTIHPPLLFILFSLSTHYDLCTDYKSTLLQLPPTHSLRTALLTNLTAALDVSPDALQSIARIRNASDISAQSAPLSPSRLMLTFSGHSEKVRCVAVCSDGKRIVSGSEDKLAKVWSATTGQVISTFTGHIDYVECVALSSDGKWAVTGGSYDDSTVRMWSTDSGRQLQIFPERGNVLVEHSQEVWAVAVSPDDCTIASAGADRAIRLWNVRSGGCDALLKGHENFVHRLAFSLDGQILASCCQNKTVKVWSVRSKSLLRTITDASTYYVSGVAFTSDGERVVSCGDDKMIKVWRWRTGKLESTLTGHTDQLRRIAVFHDGERVASGSRDKTVRIWNLRTGECEHILEGHTDSVEAVAVSRDGRTVVSGSEDSTVKVWTLE